MRTEETDIVLFEADRDVYGSSATIRQCLSFPVSLLSLKEYLKKGGYKSKVLTQEGLSNKDLVEKILSYKPKIVAATASCCEFPVTADIMKIIKKKNPSVITSVGGYHASSYPQSLDSTLCPSGVNSKGIDFLVLGEGERTFTEVANSVRKGTLDKNKSKIKGLAYISNGLLHINEPRELIGNIDSLPNIRWTEEELAKNDFDGFITRPYSSKNVAIIISERGCPFACTFCSTQNIYGKRVRTKSIQALSDEIENLQKNCNVDMLVDYAPTGNRDPKRIHDLAHEIRVRGLQNQMSIYQLWRLENPQTGKLMVKEDIISDLCNTFFSFKAGIGIEALTENDQKYIKKPHSFRNLKKASNFFERYGAIFRGFFMITPETTKEAIERCSQSDVMGLFDDLRVTYLVPYPGSPIYEEHKGELLTDNWREFTCQSPILKSKHLSEEELKNSYHNIIQGFLLNPKRRDRLKEKMRKFHKIEEGLENYHRKMKGYGFELLNNF